ncbi:MAG TPA: lysylphosphatidylglycerol synthase transmembrane domain-containing protein, partial [Pseudolabrys sp.]|nr:lysylphosphatidylglycerol synthase transmembrane domain-containing protein [Pseudolabrys sp.]
MYMKVVKPAVSVVLLVGVIFLVGYYYGTAEIFDDIRALSTGAISAILFVLLANAFAAVLRFKVIAAEVEHPITFRRAMAVVSTGSLAGAIFFQIAGQLMARGVIAGRGGVPFAAVVVITAYERFTAAIVSALFALGGAFFIFGNVYLDRSSGGAELLKIMAGLIAATTAGALMGYGRMAVRTITPLLTRHFVRRCLAIIGLTFLVQIPMQAAYVIAAHTLSPQTSIANLVAASAIVMFATSVPISLAGWGMREMSAIVGLGAIGVPAHAALTAAVLIGVGSLLVVGMLAAISLPGSETRKQPVQTRAAKPVDYYQVLAWVLPIGAATLVLFQIYVPVQSGLLNVNLADPLAMLGGVLFILTCIRLGSLPSWRVPHINLAAAVATLVLGGSLLIGADRFGWTTWAVTNRFLGWFVLLAYAATGALIVKVGQKEGLRTILLTFAGATAAVAG